MIHESQPSMRRKVVLGLGNILCRDEGLGIHALKALRERLGGQAQCELLDGGTLGFSLLPIVESCSHLLILDAVDAGRMPGTVSTFQINEISFIANTRLSQHQITFSEVLVLARARKRLPEHLQVIGAQPGDMSIGLDLSPEVARAIPEIVSQALLALTRWQI